MVEQEVQTLITKNNRPLIQMRVTRPRKHFGDYHATFLDKDGQENHHEMKKIQNNNMYPVKKKILELGL